jgi:hypothetical protein
MIKKLSIVILLALALCLNAQDDKPKTTTEDKATTGAEEKSKTTAVDASLEAYANKVQSLENQYEKKKKALDESLKRANLDIAKRQLNDYKKILNYEKNRGNLEAAIAIKVEIEVLQKAIKSGNINAPKLRPDKLIVKFDQEKSMKIYPKGTSRMSGTLAKQESEDPTGPFTANPIYYNAESGQHLYFDIENPTDLTKIIISGCAFFKTMVVIKDKDGKVIIEAGPFSVGNKPKTYTIEIPKTHKFSMHISNKGLSMKAGNWFYLAKITFE